MMGHGKHDDCIMCKTGKTVGIIENCTDKSCTDPSHKKEEKYQEQKT